MMKRAALYVRVSTQEQKTHGISVDSQIDALKAFAEEHGYIIVDTYNDAGMSARKRYKHRPELLRLLSDCQAGRVDIILFTKLDRWFRSVADYYEVQSILDQTHVPWRAIWEDYSTEDSAGVFKVNIMLSIAQAEADRTSERIKAVNEYRRANGQITYGRAPLGYKSVNSQLIKDEAAAEGVRAMFDCFLHGGTYNECLQVLREHGIRCAKESLSRRILKNPTYYGNAYGYQCDAYITKEEYDRIQTRLLTRRTRRSTDAKRVYFFAGLIECGYCGGSYHSQIRILSKGKYQYKYYACGKARNGYCDHLGSITERKIESFLLNSLEEQLKNASADAGTRHTSGVSQDKKKDDLQKKLRRIGDRYEDGDISREEYKNKRAAILNEIAALGTQSEPEPVKLPDNWLDVYRELDDQHKRHFWQTVVRSMKKTGEVIDVTFNI